MSAFIPPPAASNKAVPATAKEIKSGDGKSGEGESRQWIWVCNKKATSGRETSFFSAILDPRKEWLVCDPYSPPAFWDTINDVTMCTPLVTHTSNEIEKNGIRKRKQYRLFRNAHETSWKRKKKKKKSKKKKKKRDRWSISNLEKESESLKVLKLG